MAVYNDRITLVFAIPSLNRPAAASFQTLEVLESGRQFETLAPLDPAALGEYADQFSLGVLAENADLKQQVSALTSQRDSALAQAASLQSEVDTIPSLQQQIAALQAEVDRLTALVPPVLPERTVYPRELLGRLTKAEIVAAIRTDDEDVIFAVANLQTTVSPVLLDSDEVRMMIGSLVVAGILTPERMAEVLA